MQDGSGMSGTNLRVDCTARGLGTPPERGEEEGQYGDKSDLGEYGSSNKDRGEF